MCQGYLSHRVLIVSKPIWTKQSNDLIDQFIQYQAKMKFKIRKNTRNYQPYQCYPRWNNTYFDDPSSRGNKE